MFVIKLYYSKPSQKLRTIRKPNLLENVKFDLALNRGTDPPRSDYTNVF